MMLDLEIEPGRFAAVEVIRAEVVNRKRLLLVRAVGAGLGGRDAWVVGIQNSNGGQSIPPAVYTRLRSADILFEAMREVETRKSVDAPL